MSRLTDKIALVTGAARGLGEAMARRFAAEGATVIVNDLHQDEAERVVASGIQGTAIAADVSDTAAVNSMFEQVRDRYGRLDILVNNAGISGGEDRTDDSPLEMTPDMSADEAREALQQELSQVTINTTDEDWQRMLAVHLNGTFYCTRAALPLMLPQQSGSIINMGSIMGTSGAGFAPAYCAAKGGILALTRSWARELAASNIRVNSIAPGWIETRMTEPLEPIMDLLLLNVPLGRKGQPDDIANAALYLASDESAYTTGQCLSPNGGWHMSQ